MMISSNSKKNSGDFELNLAPIIDCLTVLITFMLGTAVFLAVGVLDAIAPSAGAPAVQSHKPPVSLEIELGQAGEVRIKLAGARGKDKVIPSEDGSWNVPALETEVEGLKKKFPGLQSLTLSAQDDVEYVDYIRVMEVMRTHLPQVFLGGI